MEKKRWKAFRYHVIPPYPVIEGVPVLVLRWASQSGRLHCPCGGLDFLIWVSSTTFRFVVGVLDLLSSIAPFILKGLFPFLFGIDESELQEEIDRNHTLLRAVPKLFEESVVIPIPVFCFLRANDLFE